MTTKKEQAAELSRLTSEMYKLLGDIEGFFFTDNGYHPNELVQAGNRLEEARMWAERYLAKK